MSGIREPATMGHDGDGEPTNNGDGDRDRTNNGDRDRDRTNNGDRDRTNDGDRDRTNDGDRDRTNDHGGRAFARRAGVVLDRDGTLIDFVRDADLGAVVPAFHPAQIRFLPGVIEGLRLLAERGFVLAIATNQPGAAKGQIPLDAITRTNDALLDKLRAEGVTIASLAVCLHHPEGGPGGDATLVRACDCRKPKPGMIRALVEDLGLDPARSFMVGDAMTDVEAGRAAGTRTALLAEIGRCEMCPMKELHGERELTRSPDEASESVSEEGARLLRTARRAPSSYGAPNVGTPSPSGDCSFANAGPSGGRSVGTPSPSGGRSVGTPSPSGCRSVGTPSPSGCRSVGTPSPGDRCDRPRSASAGVR